jgi:hypothetical protein
MIQETNSTTRNYYGHIVDSPPTGEKKVAMILPYEDGVTLRGLFSGFKKPATYAFSFWARNDRDDDTTSTAIIHIFRDKIPTITLDSDQGTTPGWNAFLLPNDTLWHRCSYIANSDMLVATTDSMQIARIYIQGGADTLYVTGIEAHLWDGTFQSDCWFSADGDSLYCKKPDGTYAGKPW